MPTAKGRVNAKDMYNVFVFELKKSIDSNRNIISNCERMIEKSEIDQRILSVFYKSEKKKAEQKIKEIEAIISRINYNTYKKILLSFNEAMFTCVLHGHAWQMGKKIGVIGTSLVERNINVSRNGHYNLHINWGATKEHRKNGGGEKDLIYWTTPNYSCVKWRKNTSMLKNKSGYKFRLNHGNYGAKKRASKFFKDNPHLSVYYLHEKTMKDRIQRIKPNIDDIPISIS